MNSFYRRGVCGQLALSTLALLGVAWLGVAFLPSTGLAQVTNNVVVSATGTASAISVTIDLDIGGTLPVAWVGWVVERTTLGLCGEPVAEVGDVTPFPTGAQTYVLTDNTAVPILTYMYRIYAVDDVGAHHILPGTPDFSPVYFHFDYASVANDGYVAMGVLVDLGWTIGLQVCQDNCWAPISFISSPPAELETLAATGKTVQLFGQLDAEFEGTFVSAVTSWNSASGCGAVANTETNWGGLKAMFR